MATKKNIVFIMNPISGTVKKAGIPRLVEKYLDKDKFSYTIQCTQYAGHATEIAEKAKDEHADIVVAIGGDGNYTRRLRKRPRKTPDAAYGHEESHQGYKRMRNT